MSACSRDDISRSDLHVHSSCSDGLYPPEKVLDTALAEGIEVLSITDHDTCDGSLRAASRLEELSKESPGKFAAFQFVPGIELSTRHEGVCIHILGYFIPKPGRSLLELTQASRNQRSERALAIADRLQAAGYPVSRLELIGRKGIVNRVALARLMVDKGIVSKVSEAFEGYIGDDKRYYVPRTDPDTVHAIRIVIDEGGIPVIAHPALSGAAHLIPYLAKQGLMGVEAFHGEHSPQEVAELEELAIDLGLYVTGGSDWHQDSAHPTGLGGAGLPRRHLEAFLDARPR